ncbi:MAG TPA: heterodisulfide reductase-related iron-sulfur binding cluster [Dehalococcoidia bacterium]|nr:heterodisulfide reductase-related iron-sulfur binding cluster [Dehalococcoidia bacterium]
MTDARPFAPSEVDLSQCVRCGLCLPHCPTYVETGLETESPRGRLYLIRALTEDLVQPTENALGHLDQCLQCRNCEAVCPSGVPYGRIMEHARADAIERGAAPASWRLRRAFLREVVAKPARLRAFVAALRLSQSLGLTGVAERLPFAGEMASLAPRARGESFTRTGVVGRPEGETEARVAMLSGCIMPLTYGPVHRATVRVLARNGCEVNVPKSQVCCGALHAHNGDLETARDLARRNIDAFLAEKPDAIVVNSAGCGAAMKEYDRLLVHDPEYGARAADFSRLVKDVHEFLVDLPFVPPTGSVDAVVTYQDSCHLAHAQRITAAPRAILNSIPGLRFVEMANADRCCGAAGVYSLTQPEMSLALIDHKMTDVDATGTDFIATANPGCLAQLDAGVRRSGGEAIVRHVIELLDRAYRAS